MRVPLRNGYTRAYVQIMQHAHTHKAVTGRVEAKKLLSRRRQSNYSHAWHKWHNQTLSKWGRHRKMGMGWGGAPWQRRFNMEYLHPLPINMKGYLSENWKSGCETCLINRYEIQTMLYKLFTCLPVYIMIWHHSLFCRLVNMITYFTWHELNYR